MRLIYVAVLLFIASPSAYAQEDDALGSLVELLAEVETFTADVRQLIVESSGDVLEESEIQFKLKRPDGFYWETIAPYPELIVTNGELLWNYQPDLLQVTVETWDPEQAGLAAQLLSGRSEKIADEYEVMLAPSPEAQAHDSREQTFVLEPLDPGSLYERVTITFVGDVLDSMRIDSTDGQRTHWTFSDQKINADIPDEVFNFEAPDDIEVIDNTSTPLDQ